MDDELRRDATDLGDFDSPPVCDLPARERSVSAREPRGKLERWPLGRAVAFWTAITVGMWAVIILVARLVSGTWML
jgi:hypothetical protein